MSDNCGVFCEFGHNSKDLQQVLGRENEHFNLRAMVLHQCDGKWKHGSGMSQRTIAVLLGVEGNELIEHSFSLAIPCIPG